MLQEALMGSRHPLGAGHIDTAALGSSLGVSAKN